MKLLDSEIFLWLVDPEDNELFVQKQERSHGVNRVHSPGKRESQMPLFESTKKKVGLEMKGKAQDFM